MRSAVIPEEAVVEAAAIDPLGVSLVLSAVAQRAGWVRRAVLTDIARSEELSSDRAERAVSILEILGLIHREGDGVRLGVSCEEGLEHAAVLRGVAYARYRQRDANSVEITLSPPVRPSRLMECLPKQGFSWARLYHTRDILIELASGARHRLTIASPFLDMDGLEWVGQLFEASPSGSERTLIVRGRHPLERAALRAYQSQLTLWSAKVLKYAIAHDPDLRTPALETFHAKIILADSDRAYIGSANMTRWSRDYCLECGVIISGPCVKPVTTLIDAIIAIADEG